MWKRIDNYMQNWYKSMGHPKGDIVMGAIGFVLGILIVILICPI